MMPAKPAAESQGINFQFGEGELVLEANTAEIGESRVEFPISYSGDAITVRMNHKFVADFLKVLNADKTITVEIKDSDSASIFRTDDGFEYVVMPLAGRWQGIDKTIRGRYNTK